MRHARAATGDLDFFVGISRHLTSSRGLLVYAENENAQSGPLSLLAVRAVDWIGLGIFPLVICALVMLTLYCLSHGQVTIDGLDLRLLIGGLILVSWWPYLKTYGHLDDALVLALAAVCLLMVLRARFIPAAVVLGLMLAVKPWAIFLLPMLVTREHVRRRSFRAPLTAVGVAAALWSPFILASVQTLDGIQPTVRLAPDSVLRLLGFDSTSVPSALRYFQLGLAFAAVAVVAVWRGRPAGALLAGVACRVALDPGTWNYYTVGFLLGALMWDLSRSSRVPYVTLLACALLPPTWMIDVPEVRAIMRLVASACALAIVLWPDEADLVGGSLEEGSAGELDDFVLREPADPASDDRVIGVEQHG